MKLMPRKGYETLRGDATTLAVLATEPWTNVKDAMRTISEQFV